MAVETIVPKSPEAAPPSRERRIQQMRHFPWATWILRIFVESFFIMVSILLALAVDNWRETAQHQRLAQQSLQVFEREMKANLALLDEVSPYHSGLRSVVAQALANPAQAADMRSIVEGLQPTRPLLNTAWQTALATGALTHIDVQTVAALSLAYSFQERFRQQTTTERPRITIGATPTREELLRNISEAYTYLNALVAAEEELRVAYQQAIDIIRTGLREPFRPDSGRSAAVPMLP